MMPATDFPRTTIAATVAGTDSGGGAGIQADLKSFAACGVYGVSVAVALTAQNTLGVLAVHGLPQEFLIAQFEALDQDLRPRAVKTGMLFSAAHIATVCQQLRQRSWGPLVVDPVMVAKSGASLLEPDAVAIMRAQLIPMAQVVTPNWPEAAALTGRRVESEEEAIAAGQAILQMGAAAVVVKGGHAPGPPTDVLVSDQGLVRLTGKRIDSAHTHGTGCTFSAAITARLAVGDALEPAVRQAKAYVASAIRHAPGLGSGHGPLEHFPPVVAGSSRRSEP